MPKDKTTIGVTPDNQKTLDIIMDTGVFNEQMDIGKFALAIAVRSKVEIAECRGTDTKWNVGSFDNDNSLKMLIPILFPQCETPYRAVEFLINAGLNIISQNIKKTEHFDLIDWLEQN